MAVSAAAVPADDDHLTEYEKQRLAHVARNREYMARLGVLQLASEVGGGVDETKPKRKSPAVRVKREPVEGTRRSARVKNVAPEHDGAEIAVARFEGAGYHQLPEEAFARGIEAIRDQVAPPTINLDTQAVETPVDLAPNAKRERKIDVALSNSFGFGGTNASVIFGKMS